MAFRRRSGTSWVTPSKIRRRSGSSWVDVDTIRRRSGSSWITVYQSYTPLTISSTGVSASTVYPGVASGRPNVTVSGGKGTLTYSWTLRETDGLAAQISSTTVAEPLFSLRQVGYSRPLYRVTVSDGISSAYTDVRINLNVLPQQGPGGPGEAA